VTYIQRDLIRSRAWQLMTSAAGPLMNFLLFIALVLPFHPRFGWIDVTALGVNGEISNGYLFMGAMAWLEMLAVLINLVPVPPLDGFQMVSEFMTPEMRHRFLTPPASYMGLFVFFALLSVPGAFDYFHNGVTHTLRFMGFDYDTIHFLGRAFNRALFKHSE